jgi:hypothetical protein
MTSKNGSSWSDAGAPTANQKQQSTVAEEKPVNDAADNCAATEYKSGMKPQPPAKAPPQEQAPRPGMIERSLQAQLGRQLQVIFSDVAEEPVPDRFIKLLEELEAREKRR